MPPRDFGCKSKFLHPKVPFIATTSNISVRFELTCIPKLTFCFFVATDYVSTPRSTCNTFTERKIVFILLYVLHFSQWTPLILHTLWKHLFSLKAQCRKESLLLRDECGLFRASTRRFLLRSSGSASCLGAVLWWCENTRPDVNQTPAGTEGGCSHLDTVYPSKQTVDHRPVKHLRWTAL